MQLKNLTLELSSKPFFDETEETMYSVCRHMFTQWKNLTDAVDVVSVMLWIADGSEIFEFSGDLEQKFEWAYWCGCANAVPFRPNMTELQKRDTHHFPVKYREDAAPRSYAWLKRLIEVIRETGGEITNKPIRIGATYDNGPEFAVSRFKFQKHREIAQGHTLYPNSVVTCTAQLHADSDRYAAFPDGIPEGTSVGTFLGSQFREFAKAMDYDYLWLSNGMGFGTETWGITGMLFDKQKFYPEKAGEAAEKMLTFWNDFFAAYPGCIVETRGSNFSVGIEIATDGCPFQELYGKHLITAPVNSPWAALNFNSGLEITAWMSHIAELPNERIPFRFYIHDPWFCNSPWLDRYGREAWDIFQPLSVGRMDEKGKVSIANSVALLTVDNTWGELPDQIPSEVIPLLKEAFADGPDSAAPLVWVYPFDEYSDIVRGNEPHPELVFIEEMFLGECVQNGLPLNTVISTGNFRKLIVSGKDSLAESILIVPVSAASEANMDALETFLKRGGKVIFYGSLQQASERLCKMLSLRTAAPVFGEAMLKNQMQEDEYKHGSLTQTVHILPQYSGGGVVEVPEMEAEDFVCAWITQDNERRAGAMCRTLPTSGQVGFVRAVLPCAEKISSGHGFDYAPVGKIYPAPALMRHLLADFGWKIRCVAVTSDTVMPRTTISRSNNAFFFNVFAPDTTAEMRINTPYGAPILSEMETYIDENGDAVWHPGKCWHKECRCFVKQSTPSVIKAKITHQEYPAYVDELFRRSYSGFVDAEVCFFIDESVIGQFEVIQADNEHQHYLTRNTIEYELEATPAGLCARMKHVTGYLYFAKVKNNPI
jgi:hypothetical protein